MTPTGKVILQCIAVSFTVSTSVVCFIGLTESKRVKSRIINSILTVASICSLLYVINS